MNYQLEANGERISGGPLRDYCAIVVKLFSKGLWRTPQFKPEKSFTQQAAKLTLDYGTKDSFSTNVELR